jgi:hypothetical protein
MNTEVPTKEKTKSDRRVILKKWLRRLQYLAIAAVVVLICQTAIGYWLLSSRWEMYVTEDKMVKFATEVTIADPLPQNFKETYTLIFPRHIEASMWDQIFFNYGARIMFKDKDIDSKPHCFCDMVYDIQKVRNEELASIDWNGRIQDLEYGFGIERYSFPHKCFDYVIQEKVKQLKGDLDHGKFPLLDKDLDEMNEDEIIELVLLIQSRTKFNRYKNTAAFDRAFNHYKDRLLRARDKQD